MEDGGKDYPFTSAPFVSKGVLPVDEFEKLRRKRYERYRAQVKKAKRKTKDKKAKKKIMNKKVVSEKDMDLLDDIVGYLHRYGYQFISCLDMVEWIDAHQIDVSSLKFPTGTYGTFKQRVKSGYYSNEALDRTEKMEDELFEKEQDKRFRDMEELPPFDEWKRSVRFDPGLCGCKTLEDIEREERKWYDRLRVRIDNAKSKKINKKTL